jgi:hypothetical protein
MASVRIRTIERGSIVDEHVLLRRAYRDIDGLVCGIENTVNVKSGDHICAVPTRPCRAFLLLGSRLFRIEGMTVS